MQTLNTADELVNNVLRETLGEHSKLVRRHERMRQVLDNLVWLKDLKTSNPLEYGFYRSRKEATWEKARQILAEEGI